MIEARIAALRYLTIGILAVSVLAASAALAAAPASPGAAYRRGD